MARGKTFRIFVSSTFNDLKAERNALAKWVFWKLRKTCEKRGYKLQIVDLRWGVRNEASVDHGTVRICLDEIARCQQLSPRPNFIVLLGDRYGWRPPPRVIPYDEMKLLVPHMQPADAKLVLHHREQPSIDDPPGWYRLDKNAVPPEYVLQPRSGEKAAFETHGAWEPEERRLHAVLAKAATEARLPDDKLGKYIASATEQEILKGVMEAPDAREHVFAFFRTITNRGDVAGDLPSTVAQRDDLIAQAKTAAEKAKAAGARNPAQASALAAMDLLDTAVPAARGSTNGGALLIWDEKAWNQLQDLKTRLKRELGADHVFEQSTSWTGNGITTDHIGEPPDSTDRSDPDKVTFVEGTLCQAVWERLSGEIDRQMAEAEKDLQDLQGEAKERAKREKQLDDEQNAHRTFGEARARVFKGREEERERIAKYLAEGTLSPGPCRPLVIHGKSGCGKSALMAKAVEEARARAKGSVLVERFIGTSPGASEIRPLLADICREVGRAYGTNVMPESGDFQKLVEAFHKGLALARPEKPLWIFLDALDQLGDGDNGRLLYWLPAELPACVRIVVSTLDDAQHDESFRALKDKNADLVAVGRLSRTEGEQILTNWLDGKDDAKAIVANGVDATGQAPGKSRSDATEPKKARRLTTAASAGQSKDPGQLEILLDRFEESEGSPLYLKLAFETARHWHSYGADIVDGDHDGGAATASQDAVFADHGDPTAAARALPVGVTAMIEAFFARLTRSHGKILVEHALGYLTAARYGLSDDEVLDLLWLDEKVKGDFEQQARHDLPDGDGALPPIVWSRLYFDLEAYLTEREVFGVRLLSWFHRQFGEVAVLLLDTDGAEEGIGKVGEGGRARPPYRRVDLGNNVEKPPGTVFHTHLASYFYRRWSTPDTHSLIEVIGQLALAGRSDDARHLLLEYPWISTRLEKTDIHALVGDYQVLPLDRQDPVSLVSGALRLSSHVLEERKAELASQLVGRLLTCRHPAVFQTLASARASANELVLLPAFPALEQAGGKLLRIVSDDAVEAAALSSDGRTLVTGSGDSINIWDVATGIRRQRISTGCSRVALRSDGGILACAPREKPITVWNSVSGGIASTPQGDWSSFIGLAFDKSEQILCAAKENGTLIAWNLSSGELVHGVDAQHRPIVGVVAGQDPETFVSVSSDGVLKQWRPTDLTTIDDVAQIEKHDRTITSIAATRDGRVLVTADEDGSLILWDSRNGSQLSKVSSGSLGSLNRLAVSDLGEIIVSYASRTLSMKVWDVKRGTELCDLHLGVGMVGMEVNDISISADGTVAASAISDGRTLIWSIPRPAPPGDEIESVLDAAQEFLERGPQPLYTALAVSPDGDNLALGDSGGVSLWDVRPTFRRRRKLAESRSPMDVVFATRPGDKVVVAYRDRIEVRDAEDGRVLHQIDQGVSRAPISLARGADICAFISHDDKTVRLLDLSIGAQLWSSTRPGTAVALSGNGVLAAWASDKGVAILKCGTQETLHSLTMVEEVGSLALSHDGSLLLVALGRMVQVWETQRGRRLRTMNHPGRVRSALLTDDGMRALSLVDLDFSTTTDPVVRVWSTPTGALEATFTCDGHPHLFRYAESGRRLIVGELGRTYVLDMMERPREPEKALSAPPSVVVDQGSGRLGDIGIQTIETQTPETASHGGFVEVVAFADDSTTLHSGSHDGSVRSWNVSAGILVGEDRYPSRLGTIAFSSRGLVSAHTYYQDGLLVADDLIHVRSRGSSVEFVVFGDPARGEYHGLALGRDGLLAFSQLVGPVQLVCCDERDVADLSVHDFIGVRGLSSYTDRVRFRRVKDLRSRATPNTLAFSANGRYLAGASTSDGIVSLWDLASERLDPLVETPGSKCCFDGDGSRLFVYAEEVNSGTIHIFDGAAKWKERQPPLVAHSAQAFCVSPTGEHLALAGYFGIEFWDLTRRTQVSGITLPRHIIPTGLAFSPDGRWLAVAAWDYSAGFVLVWEIGRDFVTYLQA